MREELAEGKRMLRRVTESLLVDNWEEVFLSLKLRGGTRECLDFRWWV